MNKVKSSLPNILTFFNLSLGVVSILMTVAGNTKSVLIYASLLVLLAALTDRLDGKVARKLGVSSEFGKELDSLSDLISFGVAPIIIAWKINLSMFGPASYLLVLVFPIAGAYRLARYNISEFDNVFRGIPITVAGGVLSIANVYNAFQSMSENHTIIHTILTLILLFLLSILMVSNFNFKKM